MIPTMSYSQIIQSLSSDFEYWRRDGRNLNVTMCGLLFARPQSELATTEIFPELKYFNSRLGPHFHLFTAGCFQRGMPVDDLLDKRPIDPLNEWFYSDVALDRLRREMEFLTSWRYRDGVELLLFNATRNARTGLILSLLPEAIRRDATTAKCFVTKDLSRKHSDLTEAD